jgi:hypothetical protein
LFRFAASIPCCHRWTSAGEYDEGNLFVGEDPMDMRGPSTDPIDRIVLISWDANGGPPVKTVFCENLSAVFGMVWHQGALYVMNAPYYTMLKDTDGDGIADVRRRLADSFGHAPGLFGLNNHVTSGMMLQDFADIIAYLESLKQPFPLQAK